VEVARREPSFLVVSPPKKVGKYWRLTVSVPETSAEVAKWQPNRYLEGRIILKTSLPKVPEVQVRVVWDADPPPPD
jgi:hypothetical protein